MNPSPIDLNFTNIILQNGIQTVIDPEWTFDFPVPLKYIVWRTCFLYQESAGEDISRCFGKYTSGPEEITVWRSMEYRFGEYAFGPASPKNINKRYMATAVPVQIMAQEKEHLASQIPDLQEGIDVLKKENAMAWEQFSQREQWLDELRREKARVEEELTRTVDATNAQLKMAYERLKQQQDECDAIRTELNKLKNTWVMRLYQKAKGK